MNGDRLDSAYVTPVAVGSARTSVHSDVAQQVGRAFVVDAMGRGDDMRLVDYRAAAEVHRPGRAVRPAHRDLVRELAHVRTLATEYPLASRPCFLAVLRAVVRAVAHRSAEHACSGCGFLFRFFVGCWDIYIWRVGGNGKKVRVFFDMKEWSFFNVCTN